MTRDRLPTAGLTGSTDEWRSGAAPRAQDGQLLAAAEAGGIGGLARNKSFFQKTLEVRRGAFWVGLGGVGGRGGVRPARVWRVGRWGGFWLGVGGGRRGRQTPGEAQGGQEQVKQAERVCGAGKSQPMADAGLAARGRLRAGRRGQVRAPDWGCVTYPASVHYVGTGGKWRKQWLAVSDEGSWEWLVGLGELEARASGRNAGCVELDGVS